MMFDLKLPKVLTDEEVALQRTFARLRKQRKQQQLKAQIKQDQPAAKVQGASKRALEDTAEVATAKAKKLIKAGAIKVEADQKASKFKRSTNFERKIKDTEKPALTPFVPFESSDTSSSKDRKQSYNTSHLDYSMGSSMSESHGPTPGRRLYVRAHSIIEKDVRHKFQTFGDLESVRREERRSAVFVTFKSRASAEKALQMDGEFLSGSSLTVEFARRQPADDENMWSSIASSSRTKGNQKAQEKRNLVTYADPEEEDDMFS